MDRSRATNLLIILALVGGTFGLYARVAHYDSINFDDGLYVFENQHVLAGITGSNILWALTANVASNWHPLTVLSLMLDVQMFGQNPTWFHLENVALHAANAALLFLVLFQYTGRRWPAAWVAAMFAWHPLHVESVAWIAERKDVLSTLFMLLSLQAYLSYTRSPSARKYWRLVAMLVLGLMSKPMLVTLPCVLLLLDYWPLRRLQNLRARVLEKLPLLAIVIASAAITYLVQSRARSVGGGALGSRIANAIVSYGVYLKLAIVPLHLAIFYPLAATLPGARIPASWVAISAAVLMVLGLFAWAFRKSQPWLTFGYLWYLGTLVPVIGLVQVGSQSRADRYTYIPLIGVFIALAWLGDAIARRGPRSNVGVILIGCLTLGGAAAMTWHQIGYWQNSGTLFRHAIDVVPDNYVAHSALGEYLESVHQPAEAADEYHAALRIKPNDPTALNNLALQAMTRGDDDEAMRLYQLTLLADADYMPPYNNFGNLLMRHGKTSDAVRVYRAAIKHGPNFVPAYHDLALALATNGQIDEAIDLWRRAIQIDPRYADAHKSLGDALIMHGQLREGIEQLRVALRSEPDRVDALTSLAWILATSPDTIFQNGLEAEQLARHAVTLSNGSEPLPLDGLAAALARQNKFADAIDAAQRAKSLADQQHLADLSKQIQRRIDGYQHQQPFTSGS